MRFFKRTDADASDAIARFWGWWAGAADRVAAAIEAGDPGSMVPEISANVDQLHKGLAWELSKGAASRHALVVSPEGDPALRPVALTWLAAAPARDPAWEYHASRQPGPLGRLQLDGVDVDLADYRAIAGWDEGRERVDVRLWHPGLTEASPSTRMRAAYLFLDNLLGEDSVERWVGAIDLLDDPTGGRTPDELRAEIERRAAEATGEAWTLMQRSDGALISVNAAVKPIDHAFCQQHLVVTVERGIEHFRGTHELEAVGEAQDRLADAIVAIGGVSVGHVTERRRRRIHYMCPDAAAARDTATAWANEHRPYSPSIDVKPDPGWTFRRDLGI